MTPPLPAVGVACGAARRYVERVTRASRLGEATIVRGDDLFGRVDAEVWIDRGNEIREKPMPLDARRELARGYSAAVSFLDFQVLSRAPHFF